MSGTLDGISVAVGGLQSDMKSVGRSLDRLSDLVESNQKATADALATHALNDAASFAQLQKDVADLKSFRSRIYGMAGGFGLFATVIGNYISKRFL